MHELKEMLCQKLREYERRGDLTGSDLEQVHVLTDTIKNIGKIEMQKGYSEGWQDYSGYRSGNNYGGGNSYADRHWVRGHYSRGMREEIDEKLNDPYTSSRDKEALMRAMEILK